ncbi:hypothetical protein V5F53_20085 [Xanthobacter sp. V4C-4]|uniref:hypothetical protein n=1 Tax=Xanthobacter cornucopiae TaxID=3119924 RepID=UPI003728E1C6
MRFLRILFIFVAIIVAIPIVGVIALMIIARYDQGPHPDGTRWPVFGSRPAGARAASGPAYKDVWFGRTLYRLPVRKYWIWVQQYNAERDYAAFGFDALVPDATPMADDPAEVAVWGKGQGWHRNLHVMVEYGKNLISQSQMLENAFENNNTMKYLSENTAIELSVNKKYDILLLDNSKYTLLANGCKRYDGIFMGGSIIQACGDGDGMIIIQCNTGFPGINVKPPSPGCVVNFNLYDKTAISYAYGYDYFDLAPDIHKNIVALLTSFRVEAGGETGSAAGSASAN